MSRRKKIDYEKLMEEWQQEELEAEIYGPRFLPSFQEPPYNIRRSMMKPCYSIFLMRQTEEIVRDLLKAGMVEPGFLARQEEAKKEVNKRWRNWREYLASLNRLSELAKQLGHET